MAEKKPGKWSGKTTNLSGRQAKKAVRVVGGGKTEKVSAKERAAAKKTVDISTTKWQTKAERGGAGKGGLLTGADGKPVTGTVKLPGGKTATYVRGKRVAAPAKKAAPAPAKKTTTTTKTNTTKTDTGKGAGDGNKPKGNNKPERTQLGGKPKSVSDYSSRNTRAKGASGRTAGMSRTDKGVGVKTESQKRWDSLGGAGIWGRLGMKNPYEKQKPKGYGRSGNKRYPEQGR